MSTERLAKVVKASEYHIRATEFIMSELEKISDKHKLTRLYIDQSVIGARLEDYIAIRQKREGLKFSYDVLLAELEKEKEEKAEEEKAEEIKA